MDAEFRKGRFAGNRIPASPVHQVSAGVDMAPWEGLRVNLDWRVVSDYLRINDLNNVLPRGDAFGVLDLLIEYELPAVVSRPWWPTGRLYLKILNLTNEEYVEFQSSNGATLGGAGEYPAPSTTFVGGVTISF